MVESDAARIGSAMRCADRSAATSLLSPSHRTRESACSPTTMPSSTTMPRVMISANSDSMLKVSPASHITVTAASSATGMPTVTQNAVRTRRNMNSSRMTRQSPIAPFCRRMLMRLVICSERVRTSWTSTPSGSVFSRSAAIASTARWMPIASPRSDLSTRSRMAGAPSTK